MWVISKSRNEKTEQLEETLDDHDAVVSIVRENILEGHAVYFDGNIANCVWD